MDQLDSLMAFNPERVFQLYQHHVSPRAHQFLREAGRLPPEGVLDAANVGLIALRAAHRAMILDALGRGARELFADGEARLLRRQTEPRYYFTTAYRVGTRDEVLAGVGSRQPREVLLEEAPGFPRSPATTPHPLVRVTERRLGRVTVRLRAPRPGLLYASESYAPGWRAEVDGRAVPILAANHAFRAVAVPAGDVTVTFRYRPPGLPAGLALSLLALVAVVAMASRRDDGLSTEAPPRPARRLRWLPWAALALLAGGVVLRIASGAPAAELRAVLGTWRPPAEGDLYRVRWEALELPPTVVAGRPFEARVTLRNVSSEPWLDPVNADPSGSGRNAVRLSYRWLDAPGRALGDFAARADLPHPVAPGGAVSLRLVVVPPATPGSYQLQLDLVHEMVAWFEGRGVPRYATPIEVEPPATAP